MRHTLAVVSDLHCGSTVGLCCPEPVELDDGGTYLPSPAQAWIWAQWTAFWKRVAQAKKKADWFGVLCNGDLVDGDHHGTPQIITRDPNVQLWVLKKCFQVALDVEPDTVIVVRGTEAHVGKGASTEEAFARWVHKEGVKVPKDAGSKMYSWWHFRGEMGGARVDAAHHGRVGFRPWTIGGAVNNLAAQIVLEYANRGETPPEIAVRSHYHTYFDTGLACRTRVVQTPAYQLHTAFAHKVVPEKLADIGGVLVHIEDGQVQVEPVLFRPARSPLVRLG